MPASHRQLKKRTRNRFDFSKVSKNFSIQPFFRAIKKNQVDWKNQMYKDRIKLVNIVNFRNIYNWWFWSALAYGGHEATTEKATEHQKTCTTTFLQKPVTISKHVWIKLLLFASVGEYRVTLVRNKKSCCLAGYSYKTITKATVCRNCVRRKHLFSVQLFLEPAN